MSLGVLGSSATRKKAARALSFAGIPMRGLSGALGAELIEEEPVDVPVVELNDPTFSDVRSPTRTSTSTEVRSPTRTSTEVRSPTRTSTEVRSPTRTSTEVRSPTRTATWANTRGNFTSTVTGGAGAGATHVTINAPAPTGGTSQARVATIGLVATVGLVVGVLALGAYAIVDRKHSRSVER